VDGANRNDFRLVEETLQSVPVKRPEATRRAPQGLCLDKGYDYAEVRGHALVQGYTPHIRSRGEEARLLRENSRRKARRWVVERTHSWLNRYRSILIRWAKKSANYVGMLHFACAILTYRKIGVFG
jgi:putative transposase